MKRNLCLSAAALLGILLAGCSVKESSFPQPERFPKVISQIRTEHRSGDVTVCNYLYDEQKRLKQVLTTRVDKDTEVTNSFCEFTYGNGRIEVGTERTQYTILLNEAGYAREILSGEQSIATYQYNANGYYYEPEVDGGKWTDYQYLLAGERCNLALIAKYESTHSPDIPSLHFTTTFEYGDQPNSASLNLSYLIMKESHSDNTALLTPMLYDRGGKRDSNLPKLRKVQENRNSTAQETVYRYTYETDEEGNITRITEKTDSEPAVNVYTITYK